MPHNQAPQAALHTVARFPRDYFLENMAVRSDNSLIITVLNKGELWFVPAQIADEVVAPVHLHTFEQNATGIVELEPDVFLVISPHFYGGGSAYVYRLDLRSWTAGEAVMPQRIHTFSDQAKGLNGACLLAPGVVLVADSFAGLIWRLDLSAEGEVRSAAVWLKDPSMGYYPGKMKPEQPGVNGVHFSAKTNALYYSSTAKKLLMSVKVDPASLQAVGSPELVVGGRMGDDFCIDENEQVIYLTTHRQNTLDVVSMDAGLNSGFTQSVAGDPYNAELVGPSSAAWSRRTEDHGRVLFMTADGGTASPPPEGKQHATLLRVTLQPLGGSFPGSAGGD